MGVAFHQCPKHHPHQQLCCQVLARGQSTGFPVARFTHGHMAGLQERLGKCLSKLRAEPDAMGSEDYINLKVCMNARSNGLNMETPAIRY